MSLKLHGRCEDTLKHERSGFEIDSLDLFESVELLLFPLFNELVKEVFIDLRVLAESRNAGLLNTELLCNNRENLRIRDNDSKEGSLERLSVHVDLSYNLKKKLSDKSTL